MSLHPLDGFHFLPTHHCITGSMRHVYLYNGHPLSEEMLLGLGAGVGFIYWHQKGTAPFLGGRANARGGFEPLAGKRTGVVVEAHTTSSARQAERALLELLRAGQPVMIMADMGFLPYMDFGGADYHFGGHGIVVCGYDAESAQVLIADRDGEPHPLSLEQLARARGSTYKPFPPCNTWYTMDFSQKRLPTPAEVRQAIAEQVHGALHPPISNFGVSGIRKAARLIPGWSQMGKDDLRAALINAYIFIDAAGGTGGGMFRYMFGRFLAEGAGITGDERLREVGDEFKLIGDRWQIAAARCKEAFGAADPAAALPEIAELVKEMVEPEEKAWMGLGEIVKGAG